MWQDIVFAVAAWGLNLAILPTLRSPNKPPLLTSAGYGLCVTVMGIALISVPLWLSGVTNVIGGILWAIVAIKTVREQERRKWNTAAAWLK
jgi:hypothetical protein